MSKVDYKCIFFFDAPTTYSFMLLSSEHINVSGLVHTSPSKSIFTCHFQNLFKRSLRGTQIGIHNDPILPSTNIIQQLMNGVPKRFEACRHIDAIGCQDQIISVMVLDKKIHVSSPDQLVTGDCGRTSGNTGTTGSSIFSCITIWSRNALV
jgi:hypothetical protein